ncbi:carboxyl-terminal protease [Nitzschia inconspicua]|uniref:Carboxyl-terminal protease n=1 Tax=Nitzschia inconspicua TaxID=303405 RepID=A0A9K3KQ42_9STRA|nr:carboxyl-terminal protease [Nitzschia inconspicua]
MKVKATSCIYLLGLVGLSTTNSFVIQHHYPATVSSSNESRQSSGIFATTNRRNLLHANNSDLQSREAKEHDPTLKQRDTVHVRTRFFKSNLFDSDPTISPFKKAWYPFLAAFFVFLSTIVAPSAAIADVSSAYYVHPAQQSILVADAASQSQLAQQEETVVEEVWNLINKYYIDPTFNHQDWEQVKQKAMAEAQKSSDPSDSNYMKIVTSMVQSLGDKYTRILDAQQYASIQKFDLIGVGVTLMPNAQKDIIVGAPPIEGSSSAKAGLKVGDFVTAVNGRPTRGRNAFDIIDQISENSNAETVTFTILRKQPPSLQSVGDENSGETFDVTMERQTMKVKNPVEYKLSEQRSDGTKVGYIRISEFNSLVNASLQKALQDLQQQGANAYVLDLRGNTGGAFQSAVEISGMFLQDRVATYVVDRNQVELPFRTPKMRDLAIDPKTPIVLWLDGMSASASEVLAGSLHDNCRAVTMGDNSFGKGLIQAVYGLKNGAGLVLTVARYVTPSGSEIQGKGVVPDISGNMPAPVFVPGLSSNTSKVDFQEIAKRLDSDYCQVPAERVPSTPSSESSLVSSG